MKEAANSPVEEQNYDPVSHYDRVTNAWGFLLEDNLHYGLFENMSESLGTATDRLTDLLYQHAGLDTDSEVLDVGCGTGLPACTISQRSGCEVVGISPSEICVQSANDRARTHGVQSKVRFQIGDGMAMDFGDASFDTVWVMESSHLMPDKAKMLLEAARVLRPGGILVLCDVMLKRSLALPEVIQYRDEFLVLKRAFGRALMEPLAFYCEEVESNGMQLIFSRDITVDARPTFAAWRENAINHESEVRKQIGDEGWRDFTQSCNILEMFWDNDVLGYAVLAARKIT